MKKLQELTLKNNFMFGAVMSDETNCRIFLEMVLGISIDRVEVSREKSLVYHPEYKGVRLDVYAKDEMNTHYDIEMQIARKPEIGKRVRYYHSQMDMELLLSGMEYAELPASYVIFICDFDPFGRKKYRYSFENLCKEDRELEMGDACKSIYLSTEGQNFEEVSKELVTFLKFIKADLTESIQDFEDGYVRRLQEFIRDIKSNRKMEERYMRLEELLKDERTEGRTEGKAEAILDILSDFGAVPEDIRKKIMSEKDMETIQIWLKTAARAESMEQFIQKIN